ncbi:MAG: phosphoribosylamine--glycine ligase [Gammaproteobacteria bacterium]|nr:phosphoribosylamine--glycine ligase [Gammaproteobacteria bacterium]
MQVLIVGSGGREHALAWKVSQSPRVDRVFVAPGNAGTACERGIENVEIPWNDSPSLVGFAKTAGIGLTIIGPEAPLVSGIVDRFAEAGLRCFGPSRQASQLEGSKTFSKDFLSRHSIPTASYHSFTEIGPACAGLDEIGLPCVIKADGLAAGKGVVIAASREQGMQTIHAMLAGNRFGDAGRRIVIEQFLTGEEASFICMVDGKNILSLASSQDHKAAFDGDLGPNTGGMGAYSPAPVVDSRMHEKIIDQVIAPTVAGMAADGMPYTGFLYAGLMIGDDRVPRVLEFNCRSGDPETQPIMLRLQSDLVEHCLAALDGKLDQQVARWDSRPALGVVMAADGYPGPCESGHVINGLENNHPSDSRIFHSGTRWMDGQAVTAGGRVLCVTALGEHIAAAQGRAYQAASTIQWDGCWYRHDIGHRAVHRFVRDTDR